MAAEAQAEDSSKRSATVDASAVGRIVNSVETHNRGASRREKSRVECKDRTTAQDAPKFTPEALKQARKESFARKMAALQNRAVEEAERRTADCSLDAAQKKRGLGDAPDGNRLGRTLGGDWPLEGTRERRAIDAAMTGHWGDVVRHDMLMHREMIGRVIGKQGGDVQEPLLGVLLPDLGRR